MKEKLNPPSLILTYKASKLEVINIIYRDAVCKLKPRLY